jgi:hypothetical protein
MTSQAAFTPEEWTTIMEGPTSAAMAVITASRGGTFRETYAEAKFFAEARKHHGASEFLDAIVSHKPVSDRARRHSKDEFVTSAVKHLNEAVTIITKKATPQELADYRSFVTSLCAAVSAAHREGDAEVSPEESAVIAQVKAAMGAAA